MDQREYIEAVLPEAEGKFHYHLPSGWGDRPLDPGMRLLVPFGRSWKVAHFIRRVARPEVTATKEVLAVLDEASLVPQGLFRLLLWVSDYYASSLGGVIRGALPQGIHAVVRRRYSLTESGEKNENTGKPLQQTLAAILAKEGSLTEPQLRKKWAESMRAREVETEPSGAESPMEIRKRLQAALAGLRRKGAIREGWEV
ncbi:MAG TPA: hypothetical protein VFA47_03435, partial [Candidatus Manganitrophaceae bacterium]|nr:hypothetical protein [Candidatus Manganitrophaceae bacterium]